MTQKTFPNPLMIGFGTGRIVIYSTDVDGLPALVLYDTGVEHELGRLPAETDAPPDNSDCVYLAFANKESACVLLDCLAELIDSFED